MRRLRGTELIIPTADPVQPRAGGAAAGTVRTRLATRPALRADLRPGLDRSGRPNRAHYTAHQRCGGAGWCLRRQRGVREWDELGEVFASGSSVRKASVSYLDLGRRPRSWRIETEFDHREPALRTVLLDPAAEVIRARPVHAAAARRIRVSGVQPVGDNLRPPRRSGPEDRPDYETGGVDGVPWGVVGFDEEILGALLAGLDRGEGPIIGVGVRDRPGGFGQRPLPWRCHWSVQRLAATAWGGRWPNISDAMSLAPATSANGFTAVRQSVPSTWPCPE